MENKETVGRNVAIDIAKGVADIMCCNRACNTKSEPVRFYVSVPHAFVFNFIRLLFEKGGRCKDICKDEGRSSFGAIFDLYDYRFSFF